LGPGDPIELTPRLHSQPGALVRDDQIVALRVVLPSEVGEPSLSLQGRLLEAPDGRALSEHDHVWTWPAGPYFHNHFGQVTLRLEFADGTTYPFNDLEVSAARPRAEEARRMLQHLASRSPRLLRACFATTNGTGPTGDEAPSVETLLQAGDRLVTHVERLLGGSFRKARTRLVEHLTVKRPGPGDRLDDRSLAHMMRHLDEATPSPPAQGGIALPLGVHTVWYDQTVVVERAESTDVYENGIVHGALRSVEGRLAALRAHLSAQQSRLAGPGEPVEDAAGYVRFEAVCHEHVRGMLAWPLERAGALIERVQASRRRAERVMPARPIGGRPHMTPFFAANPAYRPVFRAVTDWYRIGEGTGDVSAPLLGLKTLDRLYEFNCLVALIEMLEDEGWHLSESEVPEEGMMARSYRFGHASLGLAELHYEPEIHAATAAEPFWGLIKVAGSERTAFRPDFLLRFTRSARPPILVALDAKYANESTLRDTLLPGVALRYLHGIHSIDRPGRPALDHLWLLGPTGKMFWHYQHLAPGEVGISPNLGIVRVEAGEAGPGLRAWYRRTVLLQLMVG